MCGIAETSQKKKIKVYIIIWDCISTLIGRVFIKGIFINEKMAIEEYGLDTY